jgi:hypothetical protein
VGKLEGARLEAERASRKPRNILSSCSSPARTSFRSRITAMSYVLFIALFPLVAAESLLLTALPSALLLSAQFPQPDTHVFLVTVLPHRRQEGRNDSFDIWLFVHSRPLSFSYLVKSSSLPAGDELIRLWTPTISDLHALSTLEYQGTTHGDALLAMTARDNTVFAGHQGGVIRVRTPVSQLSSPG